MPQVFPWPQNTKTSAGAPVTGETMVWNGRAWIAGNSGGSSLNPISHTLTTNGTINPADTLTVITGGTAFTLAAAADTHTHIVANQSGAQITVTLELNGSSQGIEIATGSNLRLSYQATLATPTYIQV